MQRQYFQTSHSDLNNSSPLHQVLLFHIHKQCRNNQTPHLTQRRTRESSDSSDMHMSEDSDPEHPTTIALKPTPYLKDSSLRTLDTWQRRRTLECVISQGYQAQLDNIPSKVTHWNRCCLPNGQIPGCKLSKRFFHQNARNSYLIRYQCDAVYFAEVQIYFSINLHQIYKPDHTPDASSHSDSDSDTDSRPPSPIHNLAYIRLLPYEYDGNLLYTTKVGPFQVISISDIQELVGLIKNKRRLYIVNGYTSC